MWRALYRCLLLVYPARVRRELGADMEEVFAHCVGVARGRYRWLGGPIALAQGVIDALAFAVSSRWDDGPGDLQQHGSGSSTRRRPLMFKRHEITAVWRQMRQRPIGTAAIVGMLALGIGASTAMFSVVYGVLLRPLPFPDADRLVDVLGARPDRGWTALTLTEANYWDLQDRNHSFEAMGAFHGGTAILAGDAPEQLRAGVVSSGFFKALGVDAVAGRIFTPEEDATGNQTRPVLLAHAFWMRKFGGDRGIVGRQVAFGSGQRTVIGVLPAGTPWLDAADVFVPLVRRANADRGSFEYAAVGRIKTGVTIEAALADLQAVSKDLERQYPATNTGLTAELQPSRRWMADDNLRRTLWILLGAVGLLLVIACVNVTNLLLARGSSRGREIAVRAALGATPIDLIRLTLAESLALGLVACAAALGVAAAILAAIRRLDPGGIPRIGEVAINGWVFGFACVMAVVVGLATGLVPAFQRRRPELARALRQGSRGSVGDRRQAAIRNLFVGAQVALSLMLLVGAGLLVRSLVRVLQVDRGFQIEDRLMASVTIPARYGDERIVRTAQDVIDRVRLIPDVVSAAAVSGRPLTPGNTGLGLGIPESNEAPGSAVPWGTWRRISSDYFKTVGVPLLQGRDFRDDDRGAKPVRAVISRRLAELFWPGQSPIGRTIILWKGQGDTRGEVIGVVGDMRERGLEAEPTLAVYFDGGERTTELQLVMHTRGDAEAAVPAFRAAVASVDRSLPISNVRTLSDALDRSLSTRRFTMVLLAAFAGLALMLALAGVYGVLAYAIARRTAEIGVRLALGAAPRRVLSVVVAQGMRPVLVGLAVGVAAAFWLSQLMTSLLFGVTARDPWTFVAVSVALALTGLLACYLPARQVLRVDPMIALRLE